MPFQAVNEPDLAIGIDPGKKKTGVATQLKNGIVELVTVYKKREDPIATMRGIWKRLNCQADWKILVAIELPEKRKGGKQLLSRAIWIDARKEASIWRIAAESVFGLEVIICNVRPNDRHPMIPLTRTYPDDHVRDAAAVLKIARNRFMGGETQPMIMKNGVIRTLSRRHQRRRPYQRESNRDRKRSSDDE